MYQLASALLVSLISMKRATSFKFARVIVFERNRRVFGDSSLRPSCRSEASDLFAGLLSAQEHLVNAIRISSNRFERSLESGRPMRLVNKL